MNALAEFKDYYKHLDEMIAENTKRVRPLIAADRSLYALLPQTCYG